MTDRPTRPFLIGAETEYAVSGRRWDRQMDTDDVYNRLSAALQEQRAWVPDDHGYRGLFLQHGGRLYLDYGSHPEHATPECFTPRQVACYDKAGEHLLALARAGAEAAHAGEEMRITVLKNNLDPLYPDSVSYGTHESYTCWVEHDTAATALLPHLVTRLAYAGAGGLSGHGSGVGFELSQRARHLHDAVGSDTTCNRAIFGTRIRKDTDHSGDGWIRVHLIGKDSQRAPFGAYLTYATTGLLIEMLNRGLRVGAGLALADPVTALHTLSRDPWLRTRVALADGRKLTALEIQASYLEECEKALQHGGLPDWAGEAIGYWRATLTELGRDPLRLADRLDPYCKLLIFEQQLLKAGFDWLDLRGALGKLQALRDEFEDPVCKAVLEGSATGLDGEEKFSYDQAMKILGDNVTAVERQREHLAFALRQQMVDVHYHELGGLYDRLHAAGRMRDVILTPAEVEEASRTPPPGGRAALRGEAIRRHQDGIWRGDWQYLWQPTTGRCLDLRDPFTTVSREVTLRLPEGEFEPSHIDVLELLTAPPAGEAAA
jgi:proteasome accessory factor A